MKVIKRKSGIFFFFISLIVFFVLYLFANFLFNLIFLSFSETVNLMFTPKYLIRKLIVSVIYASIMAFLINRKEKQLKKQR